MYRKIETYTALVLCMMFASTSCTAGNTGVQAPSEKQLPGAMTMASVRCDGEVPIYQSERNSNLDAAIQDQSLQGWSWVSNNTASGGVYRASVGALAALTALAAFLSGGNNSALAAGGTTTVTCDQAAAAFNQSRVNFQPTRANCNQHTFQASQAACEGAGCKWTFAGCENPPSTPQEY